MEIFNSPYFCYNWRVVLYYIGIGVSFILGIGFLVNVFTMSLYFPDNFKRVKCDDTTCLLSVFGKKCYAKFEFYPNAKYQLVDCRGQKHGFYNTTVPCNINKEEEPVVYCETRIMNHGLFKMLYILLCLFQILLCCGFLSCSSALSTLLIDYLKSFVPSGDKIEESPAENSDYIKLLDV